MLGLFKSFSVIILSVVLLVKDFISRMVGKPHIFQIYPKGDVKSI
jgi:hypothetical protein